MSDKTRKEWLLSVGVDPHDFLETSRFLTTGTLDDMVENVKATVENLGRTPVYAEIRLYEATK